MSFSTKRVLTDENYEYMVAPQLVNDATPPGLVLRLQNIGSRVRKHVTEGYATNRYLSAPSSPTLSPVRSRPGQPINHAVFRSANDTLRDVFSCVPLGHSSFASPKKRAWSASDEESQDDFTIDDDGDAKMRTDAGETATFALKPDANGERPVKPLRRSKRQFRETRSLPVGLLQFSGNRSSDVDLDDEDWSLSGTSVDRL